MKFSKVLFKWLQKWRFDLNQLRIILSKDHLVLLSFFCWISHLVTLLRLSKDGPINHFQIHHALCSFRFLRTCAPAVCRYDCCFLLARLTILKILWLAGYDHLLATLGRNSFCSVHGHCLRQFLLVSQLADRFGRCFGHWLWNSRKIVWPDIRSFVILNSFIFAQRLLCPGEVLLNQSWFQLIVIRFLTFGRLILGG